MIKSLLIKNALNKQVIVTTFDDEEYPGYLVKALNEKNAYEILPTRDPAIDYYNDWNVLVVRVSQIKHIRYRLNGVKLW